MERDKTIIRTSLIGIGANVFLAALKAVIGLLAHSVAVVLDAVNNLSDALSSLITIIGTKLAGRKPDKKHPLGHGRIEYLSAAVISLIILYAGFTSLIESIKKIIHPGTPDYSVISLVIIASAVAVKIVLGTYVRRKGEEVDSDSLVASGKDAMFDAVISASTLIAALIFIRTGLSLEAYLGALISIVIIKSGMEMLRETISEILGERVDADLARQVKETVCSFEQVRGAYDLVLHNYGPGRYTGSIHIELPDTMTVREADTLERKISMKVFQEHAVALTGISVYSYNTSRDEAYEMEAKVRRLLEEYPSVIQMHGFYMDDEKKTIRFDIIISFDEKERRKVHEEICRRVEEMFPDYIVYILLDYDISE